MASEDAADSGRLRRDVGLIPLLFSSMGAIIGSGWLFGALYAVNEAGPAALFAWGLGGIVVILLALVHAELRAMFPIAGGTARYPHFSFGTLTGFTWGWIGWLGAVTIAPIEVEAVIQYASTYLTFLPLTEATVAGGSAVVLTFPLGFVVAIALLFLFTFVNLLGVKKFAETNAALVYLKIAVPVLAGVALMLVAFDTSNLNAADGFAPAGIKGVLTAISAAGVFFAMFGFEQAVQLGGESSNPRRNVPIAVIGSVLIGTAVYILLQTAFLGAVDAPSASNGWANLTFANAAGPFAGLALSLGLGWLAVILYFDSVISPGGTGLVFTASSSRVIYGLSRNGYIPRMFERVDDRGVPRTAIILCFIAGCFVFLPFPGWQKLAAFITSAYALVYSVGPLALAALRRQYPNQERPYRLPVSPVLAPLAFIAANFVVYFTGWQTNWKVFIGVALGFIVLALSYPRRSEQRPLLDWQPAMWIWPYFGGLRSFPTSGPSTAPTSFPSRSTWLR